MIIALMLHQMMEAIGAPLKDLSRYNRKIIKIDETMVRVETDVILSEWRESDVFCSKMR